ncbi:MAG TPA: hypothetical protein VFN61_05880 [Acidimicrobiales bacterium]|nr:hypothetical protein [Acidimicrobiales bacterium]
MKATNLVTHRGMLSLGASALAALSLAACGGGGGSTTTTTAHSAKTTTTTAASATTTAPASTSSTSASKTTAAGANGAATAQITANWEAFFSGKTPAARKIALLQNGQEFKQIIDSQAGSSFSKGVTASVGSVNVSGSTASVDYSILEAGNVVQPNQTGQAVKVGATWLVADGSFCSLLALEGSTPSVCSSGSGSPAAKTTTTATGTTAKTTTTK